MLLRRLFAATLLFLLPFNAFAAPKAEQVDFLMSGFVKQGGYVNNAGKAYFWASSAKTTPKDVWSSADKMSVLAQPVILDSRGCATVFADGTYYVEIFDKNNVLVKTFSSIGYSSAVDFGGLYIDVGTEYGNTATAIQDALDDLDPATNHTLLFRNNIFTISSTLTIPSNINVVVWNDAYFDLDSATNLNILGPITAPNAYIFRGAGTYTISPTTNNYMPDVWTTGVFGTSKLIGSTITANNLLASAVTVSGTVSANKFVGDGSGITNISTGSLPTNVVTSNYLAGGVSVNGNVSANFFIGNGSLLTNVAASTVPLAVVTTNYNFSAVTINNTLASVVNVNSDQILFRVGNNDSNIIEKRTSIGLGAGIAGSNSFEALISGSTNRGADQHSILYFTPRDTAGNTNDILKLTTTTATVSGNLMVTGGIDAGNNGTFFKRIVIPIGDWNMDITTNVSISHSLTLSKIRNFFVTIIQDDSSTQYPIWYSDVAPDLGGNVRVTTSTFEIFRFTGQFFDTGNFDATSFNRGYITVEYEN